MATRARVTAHELWRLGEGDVRRELVNLPNDPERVRAPAATVYCADGSARLLREAEHLNGEDLLPGLTIPLAELFR